LAVDPSELATTGAGGAGPGWIRTGSGVKAFLPESGVAPQARPVCRFFGAPGVGPNAHFYTAHAGEYDFVKRVPGWTFEGNAFYIETPIDGQCAAGATPIFRSYNNGYACNDSNHRYTPEPTIYAQMQAQGWIGQGLGPLRGALKGSWSNR
jgi:serine protease